MAVGKSIGREIVWAVDYKCTNRRRQVGAMSLLGPCSKGSSAEVLGPLWGGGRSSQENFATSLLNPIYPPCLKVGLLCENLKKCVLQI